MGEAREPYFSKIPAENGRRIGKNLAWLSVHGLQCAFCFPGRFPFSRCQRASGVGSALRCAASRVLVKIVYREQKRVTPLCQA